MVRKGSPVRVRQRALEKAPLKWGFSLPEGAPAGRGFASWATFGPQTIRKRALGRARNGSIGWARGERGEDRGDLADVADRPVGNRDDELVSSVVLDIEHHPVLREEHVG